MARRPVTAREAEVWNVVVECDGDMMRAAARLNIGVYGVWIAVRRRALKLGLVEPASDAKGFAKRIRDEVVAATGRRAG
jgi:hypothetical protein